MSWEETPQFDQWFTTVKEKVKEETGVEFRDVDSVIEDFESGMSAEDVAKDIIEEYRD